MRANTWPGLSPRSTNEAAATTRVTTGNDSCTALARLERSDTRA